MPLQAVSLSEFSASCSNKRIKTDFVNRSDGSGADPEANESLSGLGPKAFALEIGQELMFGLTIRVRNSVTYLNSFATWT
jgi:hypothetical protein